MGESVYSESLKCTEDYKNGCPSVVEREGKVDEDFVGGVLRGVMLLCYVINVCYSRADEKRQDES